MPVINPSPKVLHLCMKKVAVLVFFVKKAQHSMINETHRQSQCHIQKKCIDLGVSIDIQHRHEISCYFTQMEIRIVLVDQMLRQAYSSVYHES